MSDSARILLVGPSVSSAKQMLAAGRYLKNGWIADWMAHKTKTTRSRDYPERPLESQSDGICLIWAVDEYLLESIGWWIMYESFKWLPLDCKCLTRLFLAGSEHLDGYIFCCSPPKVIRLAYSIINNANSFINSFVLSLPKQLPRK